MKRMNPIQLLAPDFFIGKSLVVLKTGLDLLIMIAKSPSLPTLRLAKLIWTVKPNFTMVKSKNLMNLYNLVQKANSMSLDGDIVECGVWNGGSAALMAFACLQNNAVNDRLLWLFDSFAGLPPPGPRDGTTENKYYFPGLNEGSIEKVEKAFRKLSLPMDSVKIFPGWFENTLTKAEIDRIAILHVDADWYSSVMSVLQAFYKKVVPGGFVVLDDYGYWEGCNRAFEDFVSQNKIEGIKLEQVDSTGAYFQKPF
jgi:O-methyltransferase